MDFEDKRRKKKKNSNKLLICSMLIKTDLYHVNKSGKFYKAGLKVCMNRI